MAAVRPGKPASFVRLIRRLPRVILTYLVKLESAHMPRNHWTATLAAAVFGVGFLLAGCASAAPKAAASSHTSAAVIVKGNSADSSNSHILVYSINTDGADFRAVVTGAIGDYGPAVTVFPNGSTDTSHSSQLELKLTRGSFRLSIAALEQAFVTAASREPIYPRTCSDFASATAAAPIVAHSGTGSYRGISGSFQMTVTLNEVEASSCRPANPANFLWQVISMSGSGTIAS
jgi:hypothetical protein